MAVYVDNYRVPYGRMRMSHMMADTEAELHAMADAIGVARRWYQLDTSWPHYDVCEAKRQHAIRLGARELTTRELALWRRRYRLILRGVIAAFDLVGISLC